MVLIFAAIFGNMLPVYSANWMGLKFFPRRNKTLFGLVYSNSLITIQSISFATSGVCFQLGSFLMVALCTLILTIKLRKKMKWRQMSSVSGQADRVSSNNQKVTKMVIVMSTLFIGLLFPFCLFTGAMIIEPEFSLNGKYGNLFLCVASIGFTLESTNSATSIFVYYKMSSRYRKVFRRLFLCRGDWKRAIYFFRKLIKYQI